MGATMANRAPSSVTPVCHFNASMRRGLGAPGPPSVSVGSPSPSASPGATGLEAPQPPELRCAFTASTSSSCVATS
eukprot:5951790-Pyramimonas_sp.AAC.1